MTPLRIVNVAAIQASLTVLEALVMTVPGRTTLLTCPSRKIPYPPGARASSESSQAFLPVQYKGLTHVVSLSAPTGPCASAALEPA